jgi:hypothetical protein
LRFGGGAFKLKIQQVCGATSQRRLRLLSKIECMGKYTPLFTMLLSLLMASSAWSYDGHVFDHDRDIVDMLSPKLHAFLNDNVGAARVFNKALRKAFSDRKLKIYYAYSTNQTRAYHYYVGDAVVIVLRGDLVALDEYLGLVFEILNSENEDRFLALCHRAELGSISRLDFAHGMLRGEFEALKKEQSLVRTLKFSTKDTLESYFYKRTIDCPDKFEEFLGIIERQAATTGRDVIKDYERDYDSLRKR